MPDAAEPPRPRPGIRARSAVLLAHLRALVPGRLRRRRDAQPADAPPPADIEERVEIRESLYAGSSAAQPGMDERGAGAWAWPWPWSGSSPPSVLKTGLLDADTTAIPGSSNAAATNTSSSPQLQGVLKTPQRTPTLDPKTEVASSTDLVRKLKADLQRQRQLACGDEDDCGSPETRTRQRHASPPPQLRAGTRASGSSASSPRAGRQPAGEAAPPAKASVRRIRFPRFACLLDAASEGDVDEVRSLLAAPPSPDSLSCVSLQLDGASDEALRNAARRRVVNQCNAAGVTALHCAVAFGHAELARVLIHEAGALVNVADEHGWTPLHSASQNGDIACIELLHAAGADVEARDELGNTPLDVSASAASESYLYDALQAKLTASAVTALYDFDRAMVGDGAAMRSFKQGDRLEVIDRPDDEWWRARRVDARTKEALEGLIPRTFVQ